MAKKDKTVPSSPSPKHTLESLLAHTGMTRAAMRNLMYDVGTTTLATAYAFLRSQDRIPADLTPEQFEPLFIEMMA